MTTTNSHNYSNNAFQSLLHSTTRPITFTLSSSSQPAHYPPYLILFQHTLSLPKRLLSSDPTAYESYERAGLEHPQSITIKDLSGGFIMQTVIRNCVEFCKGAVVYVRVSDNLGWNENDDEEYDHGTWGDEWRRRGIVVDLSSDPLGWNVENDYELHEIEGTDTHDNEVHVTRTSSSQIPMRVIKGNIRTLQSIVETIWEACRHLTSYKDKYQSKHIKQRDKNTNDEDLEIQPIPIVFDSITPLTLLHGPHAVKSLFQSFKHPPPSTSHDEPSFISSPIILPITMETLTLYYHRILEDASDAVFTLTNGQLQIAKRSSVRKGGMTNVELGSLGVKLVTEVQDVSLQGGVLDHNHDEHPPVEEVKAFTTTSSEKMNTRNSRILKPHKIVLKHEEEEQEHVFTSRQGRCQVGDCGSSSSSVNTVSDTTHSISGVRIYMDDDDPEFDDVDMEDVDDDLDI